MNLSKMTKADLVKELKQVQVELAKHKSSLETVIEDRTAQLQTTNEQLIRELQENERREQIIREQSNEILALSNVVFKLWDGVVVAPLIGSLDSRRTNQFMETFLDAIDKHAARVAIIDITGVPTMDTATAQHLVETIAAAALLGAHVLLSGVRPMIAQTLVHLGVDFSDLNTTASLGSALAEALKFQGVEFTNRTSRSIR